MEMKPIFAILLTTFSGVVLGQVKDTLPNYITSYVSHCEKRHWHQFKPNTKADSLAIIRHRVKSVTEVNLYKSDYGWVVYQTIPALIFYWKGSLIDSVKDVNKNDLDYFDTYKCTKSTDSFIRERVEFQTGYQSKEHPEQNWQGIVIYKRTNHLNKDGLVYLTENKCTKGMGLEGESFTKIKYEYKDGLLVEVHLYEDFRNGGGYQYMRKYVYAFYE
jgi:hypothetical protein